MPDPREHVQESDYLWRPGDALHIGFGLMWLGFAVWGVATGGPAWAIAWWALAAGFHLGRMIERLP